MDAKTKRSLGIAGAGTAVAAIIAAPIWLATRKPPANLTLPPGGTAPPSGAQVTVTAVSLSVGGG